VCYERCQLQAQFHFSVPIERLTSFPAFRYALAGERLRTLVLTYFEFDILNVKPGCFCVCDRKPDPKHCIESQGDMKLLVQLRVSYLSRVSFKLTKNQRVLQTSMCAFATSIQNPKSSSFLFPHLFTKSEYTKSMASTTLGNWKCFVIHGDAAHCH
jgi:hypothetical protein